MKSSQPNHDVNSKHEYEGKGDWEGLVVKSDIPVEQWDFGTEVILTTKEDASLSQYG